MNDHRPNAADDPTGADLLSHLTSTVEQSDRDTKSKRSELLFRVMLWSLGIAAVLGVGAVLTASFDVVGRVVGTAALTGIVSALLWQTTHRIGLARLVVRRLTDIGLVSFYVFALLGVWDVGRDREMWGTAFSMLVGCALTAGGMWQTAQPGRRISGFILAASAIPALFCWLIAVWVDSRFDDEIFAIGATLVPWAAGASACLVGHTKHSQHHWRWLGVAAALVGFGLSVALIFESYPRSESLYKLVFVTGSIGAVVIHANLSLLAPLLPSQLWLRISTVATVGLTAICVDAMVITESPGNDFLARLTIAFVILSSAGTLAVAFIGRRNRSAEGGDSDTTAATSLYANVEMTCPKCGQSQQLKVGTSHCRTCGLGFRIRLFDE